jgi:predicted RNA-binding Zn-ribbon protein involved in translation (DUF1610 family)
MYPPGALLLGAMLGRVFDADLFFPVAISWMVAIWIASYRSGSFRCPRCGEPFYYRGSYRNGFARRCLHCGLKKWTNEDLAPPA